MHIHALSDDKMRPDIARAFAHIASGGGLPEPDLADPIAIMRRFVDIYGDVDPRAPLDGVEIRSVQAGGVPAEWISPQQPGPGDRLVYLHGGGWVAGGLQSHRPIVAALACLARTDILLVDYRLAPEHPFPAGLEDCERAFAWAEANGPEGPSPARRLYLAGDSAGGNLAASLCQRAIAKGSRVPDRMVLLSAVLDAQSNPARGGGAHVDANQDGLELVLDLYLQGATRPDDPAVSPIHTPEAVLAHFPPCLLQVSEAEYLLWDSQAFAGRLQGAGCQSTLSVWPSMPHVWHAFLDLLPEARCALEDIADFLQAAPAAPPSN